MAKHLPPDYQRYSNESAWVRRVLSWKWQLIAIALPDALMMPKLSLPPTDNWTYVAEGYKLAQ